MQTLALQGVDAARTAGARYADVRLTRTVRHQYHFADFSGFFERDVEEIGIGIRVLVNGYWGFAASPYWATDEVVRLARDAVSVASANAKGPTHPVELGDISAMTGTWATPIKIDPFTIPIEEKLDYIGYWNSLLAEAGLAYSNSGYTSHMIFVRQEQVTATSSGTLVTQTCYESGSWHELVINNPLSNVPSFSLRDLDWAAKGWEQVLDAKIPDQIPVRLAEQGEITKYGKKPATVGRYTLICDGATMASLVGETLGTATQLDRALGYEANASGTSFIDDPLAMVGTLAIAPHSVTVMANRSAPAQLATVQWDHEGVIPQSIPLIKDGVLVDFQTTRESAGWLAPYYQKHGKKIESNGCAAAPDALSVTLQHMPNLELVPNPSAVSVPDLVANVAHGILVESGEALDMDSQARNGLLTGQMREIRNGKLGPVLIGGTIMFNTIDLWKNLIAVAGKGTQATRGWSRFEPWRYVSDEKGQPAQTGSYSVQAVAAAFENQPLIDVGRRA